MFTHRIRLFIFMFLAVAVLGIVGGSTALAQGPQPKSPRDATTKALSTNFTLVNLSNLDAPTTVQYFKTDGSAWTASAASSSFTVPGNGGQVIVRQYTDTTMNPGSGSAVVSSQQQLGAVVQIQNKGGGNPTSGAYAGFLQGSSKFYVPLVGKQLSSASGVSNSQIWIQNTSPSAPASVSVQFTGTTNYTKSGISIPANSTFNYDLTNEANLPNNWSGSAVVDAGTGSVVVISNFFQGADTLQTYNAFPSTSLGPTWLVPLFTSRLANGLSTPVAVQNLSGGQLAIGAVTLTCTPDPTSSGLSSFTKSNTAAIPINGAYYFNPVTDTSFTAGWFGSCRLSAGSANVVSFVQMRFIGTANADSYDAINAGGTNKTVFAPLVAKRLSNGFATAVTIQNLSSTADAHVSLTYKHSPDCTGCADFTAPSVTILKGTSLIQNQRVAVFTVNGTAMPDGWFGTLRAVSSDQPIDGFVQLTYINGQPGDTFMTHNAFTLP